MNIFRLIGDMSHLFAIVILLAKIWQTRSVSGISGKSQFLFGLVFTTRYLDLFTVYISAYNTTMKIAFVLLTWLTVFLVYCKYRATYDGNHDSFRAEWLVITAAGLAVLVNHQLTVVEVLWTYSIYLESVAILPQLFLISKTGSADTITSHYLFALGSYRAFYIINWIYRYFVDDYFEAIAVIAGCLQTVLYADFFYVYVTRVVRGKQTQIEV
ncbi:hypothetical protein BOX15_Mlig011121g1 [Macrostomum lignano]|uniref:ER lumen protein-retaining receptor n=1 Tax=Macrostomum lignano TaxID=282301 RepID=A0A267EKU4_9PLAT|nr:hypothetical protein BOX15_Mlig011121g1 [Macrostomum lignano]